MLGNVVCKTCNQMLGRVHTHERYTLMSRHIKKEHPEVAKRLAELQKIADDAIGEVHDITGEGSDIRYFFRNWKPKEEGNDG